MIELGDSSGRSAVEVRDSSSPYSLVAVLQLQRPARHSTTAVMFTLLRVEAKYQHPTAAHKGDP